MNEPREFGMSEEGPQGNLQLAIKIILHDAIGSFIVHCVHSSE